MSHGAWRVTGLLDSLRSGEFITPRRITIWAVALLIGFSAALLFLAATAHGLDDYKGRPLGTDFSSFYAAGTYVHEDRPAAPFDPRLQHARERAIFGGTTPFYSWNYPPFFLLVASGLSCLPYIPALLLWQIITLGAYLAAIAALLRKFAVPAISHIQWLLPALAYPAVFVNFTHGQNGFLTAALVAGGLAALDEWPVLAGVLFGLLAYKPQFTPVIPLALLVAARWRALSAAICTVVALAGLATMAFGYDVWHAFFASTDFTRRVLLEQGSVGFERMQSVFACARLWGVSVPFAYVLQAIASFVAAAVVAVVWRGSATLADKGALLGLGALLATPFCLDYDMMVLAPAIALLGAQGIARGFRPYERMMLAALWLVPIVAREAAGIMFLPLGLIVMVGAFAVLASYQWRSGSASEEVAQLPEGVLA